MTRSILALVAAVAAAAAALSFAALDELGRLCGFGTLSLLLPVVLDVGATAGTLAWLARSGAARTFGRVLALVLLVSSVAGNATAHGLAAYAVAAPWWAVVAVSAIPPAVLAALVHLAVLVAQGRTAGAESAVDELDDPSGGEELRDEHGMSRLWADAAPLAEPPAAVPAVVVDPPVAPDRAAELLAAGAGRVVLARELGLSVSEARRLAASRRNGHAGGAR